uniref:Vitelline membrane outer layer 1 homolog n=1 Tax=Equus asinus TaxID=9793 RepID=A0A9L0JH58_EQUAS
MERVAGAKLLLLLLSATCWGRARADGLRGYKSVIEVTNGGPWGHWAWPEMCPDGFFASGFSLKVGRVEWAAVVSRRRLPGGFLASRGGTHDPRGQHGCEQRALPLLRRHGAGGAWPGLGRLRRLE